MSGSSQNWIIVVDIGGTRIKYAIYNRIDKEFSKRDATASPQAKGDETSDKEAFIEVVSELIKKICKESKIEVDELYGVGILVPALVDFKTNIIKWIPYLDIHEIDLKDELKKRIGVYASIGADVTVETLGTAALLDTQDRLDGTLLGVSAGTSIGLGVIAEVADGTFRILQAPDLGFNAELFRDYGVSEEIGCYIPTPDHHLGWEVAARGLINSLAERVDEVKETVLLKDFSPIEFGKLAKKEPEKVYDMVVNASDDGDILARRVYGEALDPDTGKKLVDGNLHREVVDRIVSEISSVNGSKLYELDTEFITPKIIDECAQEGDNFALELLRDAGHLLGASLAVLIPFINPSKVVFFGGVSKSATWLDAVKKTVYENTTFKGEILSMEQDTRCRGAVCPVELDKTGKCRRLVS
jgi:predicted NBD/HSP70 family sugar kinase